MRLVKSGFTWCILLLIAAGMAAPLPTFADGIPPAVISASVSGGPSISTVGTVTGSGCIPDAFCQASSVSVSYANGDASVSGNASMSCTPACEFVPGQPDSGGQGSVTFYFSVVGSKSETVPLLFTGKGDAFTLSAGDAAVAEASVNTPSGNFDACHSETCLSVGGPPDHFSFSTIYNASPNHVYVASVSADGSGLSVPMDFLNFSADLKVQIEPSFVDASDFKLEFSPPSSSNVSEPGSLLLLGTGLLVLVGFKMK